MSKSNSLSPREKTVALLGAGVLFALVVVGYLTFSNGAKASLVAAVDAQQTKDHQNHITNQQRWIKDLRRELNDIRRSAPTADLAAAEGALNQFDSCILSLSAMVGTDEFWNENQTCNDFQQGMQDALELPRAARNCGDRKKDVSNRRKERKNIDRDIKDINSQFKKVQKTESDQQLFDAVMNIASQIDAQFKLADVLNGQACSSSDIADQYNDIQSELNTLFQDWYSNSNDLRNAANERRQAGDNINDFNKNLSRQCEKDMKREFTNFQRDVTRAAKKGGTIAPELQASVDQVKQIYDYLCVELISKMKTALDAGDNETFNDARNEFQTNQQDFWNTMNESRNSVNEESNKQEQLKNITQDLKNKDRELRDMDRNLNRLKKLYARAAKKYADAADRKDALAKFGSLLEGAEELSKRMAEGIAQARAEAPNDPDSYWFDRNEELNDIRQEFDQLQQTVNLIAQVMQSLKDSENGIKQLEKNLKRASRGLPKEKVERLQELISDAKSNLSAAWSAAIENPEDAISTLESLRDLEMQWNDVLNGGNEDDFGYGTEPTETFSPPPANTEFSVPPPPVPSTSPDFY